MNNKVVKVLMECLHVATLVGNCTQNSAASFGHTAETNDKPPFSITSFKPINFIRERDNLPLKWVNSCPEPPANIKWWNPSEPDPAIYWNYSFFVPAVHVGEVQCLGNCLHGQIVVHWRVELDHVIVDGSDNIDVKDRQHSRGEGEETWEGTGEEKGLLPDVSKSLLEDWTEFCHLNRHAWKMLIDNSHNFSWTD